MEGWENKRDSGDGHGWDGKNGNFFFLFFVVVVIGFINE